MTRRIVVPRLAAHLACCIQRVSLWKLRGCRCGWWNGAHVLTLRTRMDPRDTWPSSLIPAILFRLSAAAVLLPPLSAWFATIRCTCAGSRTVRQDQRHAFGILRTPDTAGIVFFGLSHFFNRPRRPDARMQPCAQGSLRASAEFRPQAHRDLAAHAKSRGDQLGRGSRCGATYRRIHTTAFNLASSWPFSTSPRHRPPRGRLGSHKLSGQSSPVRGRVCGPALVQSRLARLERIS